MAPAVVYGAALLTGLLIGFMFPLVGTFIISVVLGSLLFRAAKDLAITKPKKRALQSHSSQAQASRRNYASDSSVTQTSEKHDWPLAVHGYDSPELFRKDALMHIRQHDREIAEHERNIHALLAEIKKLEH